MCHCYHKRRDTRGRKRDRHKRKETDRDRDTGGRDRWQAGSQRERERERGDGSKLKCATLSIRSHQSGNNDRFHVQMLKGKTNQAGKIRPARRRPVNVIPFLHEQVVIPPPSSRSPPPPLPPPTSEDRSSTDAILGAINVSCFVLTCNQRQTELQQ